MIAVYEKELRSYFSSMTGYVFVALLLLLSGVMTAAVNFFGAFPTFENSLYTVSYVFLLSVPVLTMSSGAEERKSGTDVLLRSLPLSPLQIVMGKYLALLTVFALPCAVMSLYPAVLSTYGAVNCLSAYGALLGFFLLGACLLAFGLAVSLSVDSPVISAVVTFFSLLFVYLLGGAADLFPGGAVESFAAFLALGAGISLWIYAVLRRVWVSAAVFAVCGLALTLTFIFAPTALEGAFGALLRWLCVYERFTVFLSGLFDLSGVVYFLSVTALCLIFGVQIYSGRRER